MDVTASNFTQCAEEFEQHLASADFVAIDEEMTGIMMDETQPGFGDSCEERYAKMCKVTNEFTLMQVGFCLFHNQPDESLVARPFNFYVFPDGMLRAWSG